MSLKCSRSSVGRQAFMICCSIWFSTAHYFVHIYFFVRHPTHPQSTLFCCVWRCSFVTYFIAFICQLCYALHACLTRQTGTQPYHRTTQSQPPQPERHPQGRLKQQREKPAKKPTAKQLRIRTDATNIPKNAITSHIPTCNVTNNIETIPSNPRTDIRPTAR